MIVKNSGENEYKLTLLTMGARKSLLQIFEIPGCACINGSLHMTIYMVVLIESLKAISSNIRWFSCNVCLPRIIQGM